MKFYKILTCLILFAASVHAQNFFPMNNGNLYQFKTEWNVGFPVPQSFSGFYKMSVAEGDTVNGDIYYRFISTGSYYEPVFNPNFLFRYDQAEQKLWVKESVTAEPKVAVDFTIPANAYYTSNITGSPLSFQSSGVYSDTLFGIPHSLYRMYYWNYVPGLEQSYIFTFIDNIGIAYFSHGYLTFGSGSYGNTHTNIGCIIDSIKYDSFEFNIDSLYPVTSRKINEFPFDIKVSYDLNYKQFVDSFYLSVEHTRMNTVVQTAKMNFSHSVNPAKISFNLPGMEPGDQIKLKVILSDTSIFYHEAACPAEGWEIINVLDSLTASEDPFIPAAFSLEQNYPNPFNPVTTIKYSIPEGGNVILKVYNIFGEEISELENEYKPAGDYQVRFSGKDIASGIYFYKININKYSYTRKMMVLK